MSRLGYYCRSCRYFRENISSSLKRHILAAKRSLCEMEQDPFGNCLCSHYEQLKTEKMAGNRAVHPKHSDVRDAINY